MNNPPDDTSTMHPESTKSKLGLANNGDAVDVQPYSPKSANEPESTQYSYSMKNLVPNNPTGTGVKNDEETNSDAESDYSYCDEKIILNLETVASFKGQFPEEDAIVKKVMAIEADAIARAGRRVIQKLAQKMEIVKADKSGEGHSKPLLLDFPTKPKDKKEQSESTEEKIRTRKVGFDQAPNSVLSYQVEDIDENEEAKSSDEEIDLVESTTNDPREQTNLQSLIGQTFAPTELQDIGETTGDSINKGSLLNELAASSKLEMLNSVLSHQPIISALSMASNESKSSTDHAEEISEKLQNRSDSKKVLKHLLHGLGNSYHQVFSHLKIVDAHDEVSEQTFYEPIELAATNEDMDEKSEELEAEIKFLPGGESGPKYCFLPALPGNQFRVYLRQAGKHQLVQTIGLRNKDLTLQFASRDCNGVTSLISATSNSNPTVPMNISLVDDMQRKTMASARLHVSKFITQVKIVTESMAELIIQLQDGKYSKIFDPDKKEIKAKFRNKLIRMNMYAGIIYQIAKDFSSAIDKFRSGIYKALASRSDDNEKIPTFIGFHRAFTKQAIEGILPLQESLLEIQSGFTEISSTVQMGKSSLAALMNTETKLKLKPDHIKSITNLLNAIRKMQFGAKQNMNFEAVLMSIVTDIVTIQNLKTLEPEEEMDQSVYKRKSLDMLNLYTLFDIFVRYSKKLELLSSYTTLKSMDGLRRFWLTDSQKTIKPFWSRRRFFSPSEPKGHETPKPKKQTQKESKKVDNQFGEQPRKMGHLEMYARFDDYDYEIEPHLCW